MIEEEPLRGGMRGAGEGLVRLVAAVAAANALLLVTAIVASEAIGTRPVLAAAGQFAAWCGLSQ